MRVIAALPDIRAFTSLDERSVEMQKRRKGGVAPKYPSIGAGFWGTTEGDWKVSWCVVLVEEAARRLCLLCL